MLAITANTLALPHVVVPDLSAALQRPVRSVTTAPSDFEGEGVGPAERMPHTDGKERP